MAYSYDVQEDDYGLWLVASDDNGLVRDIQLANSTSPNYSADDPVILDLAARLGCTVRYNSVRDEIPF